jgi:hypothetical protein
MKEKAALLKVRGIKVAQNPQLPRGQVKLTNTSTSQTVLLHSGAEHDSIIYRYLSLDVAAVSHLRNAVL